MAVLRLVLAQGLRLTLPGVAIGLVVSLAAARVMANLLFEVSTLDPLTYGGVALVLTAVSIGASCLPAYRATRLNPITTMKGD